MKKDRLHMKKDRLRICGKSAKIEEMYNMRRRYYGFIQLFTSVP